VNGREGLFWGVMNFLFVHQNFPGQFPHVARALAGMPGNRVVAIAEEKNVVQRLPVHPNVVVKTYRQEKGSGRETHHYIRDFESAVRRGQTVARLAIEIRKSGFHPHVVVGHPAWGETLFLKDVFPNARHISYFEFFYRADGGDVGFDPEFPSVFDDRLRIRVKNTTQLLSLEAADAGISPTLWQQSRFPEEFHSKIRVIHEGVDTAFVRPDPDAAVELDGMTLKRCDKVVTFLSRNLEPYRGFHVFMRTLPLIQKACPEARIVIIGGDGVSYGRRLPEGQTYRAMYAAEAGDKVDWSKVHFTGRVPYNRYLSLLQVSSAHIYLTYPFVLSWSMIEAMSLGCALIASATPPVQEVVEQGENGILVDFFDRDGLAAAVADALDNPGAYEPMRQRARETAVERYDLRSKCLPEMLRYLSGEDDCGLYAVSG